MKLGFLTACLPDRPLADIAGWAGTHGYQALEVAVWPTTGSRDFEAGHLDVAHFDQAAADATRELMQQHTLDISALAYYENNLHPDPARRQEIRNHLKHAIDAAALLDVPYVGTFIGRDWTAPVADNLRQAERILPELVDYAGERGVRLIVENCVMEGWHPDGYPGNLAYSPELWEWMFSLGFYLNFDPSHLMWIGIDPVRVIAPYAERIVHAQAKDVELDPVARDRYGFYGKTAKQGDPWDMGWWRYRIPGLGQVDWAGIVGQLKASGFTGTLSVEHEDPVWSGTTDKILGGLEIAHQTLHPLLSQDKVGNQTR